MKKQKIKWIDVDDSDRVEAIAYNSKDQAIYVRFPDGTEWYYGSCTERQWSAFKRSSSKGRYIADVLDHKPNRSL